MRVLLVEDDILTTKILLHVLQKNHVVDAVTDGLLGWEFTQTYPYDLVLLDVMLPRLDGVSLCQRLRRHHYGAWIMMITSRDRPEDRVAGLEAGADDYLTKPLDLAELEVRIRNISRRSDRGVVSQLTWGALTLEPAKALAFLGGNPLTLTKKELAILELFLRYPHRVHSRFDIIEQVWTAEDAPTEDTVKSHLRSLRSKLRRAGAREDYFESLYGQGYRLNPALDPKSAPPAEQGDRQQLPTPAWQHFQERCWHHLTVLESFVHQPLSTPLHTAESLAQESLLGLSAILRTMGLTNASLWLERLSRMQTLAIADLGHHLPTIRVAITQYQDCAVSVLFTKTLWLVGKELPPDYRAQIQELAVFWHFALREVEDLPDWGAIARRSDAILATETANLPDLPAVLLLPAADFAAVAPHPKRRCLPPQTPPEQVMACLEFLVTPAPPLRLAWVGADAARWVSTLQPLMPGTVLTAVAHGSALFRDLSPEMVDLIVLESDQVAWVQNLGGDPRWRHHGLLVRSRHPVPAAVGLDPQWSAPELAQWLLAYGRSLRERTCLDSFPFQAMQRLLHLAQRHEQPYSVAVLQTDAPTAVWQCLQQALRQEDSLVIWQGQVIAGLYGSQQADAIERLAEVLGNEKRMLWGGVAQFPTHGKTLSALYARALTASYQSQHLFQNAILPVGWVPLPMANSKLMVDVLLIAADAPVYEALSTALHLRSIHVCWLPDLETALTMIAEEPTGIQPRLVLVSDSLGPLDPLILALDRPRAAKNCPVLVLQSQSHPPTLKNGITDILAMTLPLSVLVAEIRRYL
jgi:DNA-binding response OmpR family regulator